MKTILTIPPGVNCLTIELSVDGDYTIASGLKVSGCGTHIEGMPSCTLSQQNPPTVGSHGRIYLAGIVSASSDGAATLGRPDPNNPGWLNVRVPSIPHLQRRSTLTPDTVYRNQGNPMSGSPLTGSSEWFAVDLSDEGSSKELRHRCLVIAPGGTLRSRLGEYSEQIIHVQSVLGGVSAPKNGKNVADYATEAARLLGSIQAELSTLAAQ